MDGLRPAWAVKVIMVIVVASIFFRCVSATNHTVGGLYGWSLTSNLQAWTATSMFYVGDSLVFRYEPKHDVLEVGPVDFATCRISNPMTAYDDGDTVVELKEVGTRYFICGKRGHCALGLKVRVQVLPSVHHHAQPPSSSGSSNPNATADHDDAASRGRDDSPSPPTTHSPAPTSLLAPSRGEGGRGPSDDGGDPYHQKNQGGSTSVDVIGVVWLVFYAIRVAMAALDSGPLNLLF